MLELKYDDLMNPTLQAMHELGGWAYIKEIEEKVTLILKLSKEDASEIQYGNRTKLAYRLAWTRNYLKHYGLLKNITRGVWALTPEGVANTMIDQEEVKRLVKKIDDNPEEENNVEDDLNAGNYGDDDSEKEEVDLTVPVMEKPFDPTKIDIDTKTPSLDTLIKRIKHKTIQLDTESYFQRKDDLWNKVNQSRLIESILIRFPLPAFFFDASDDSNWLVVDGLQRLSSIRNFVEGKLALTNLEFLTHLQGKTWNELSSDLQRLIEESQVVIYKIMPGTPTDVKFNIFKRINTGGLILEPQEIRHALFQGKPAKFIAELATMSEFLEATDYKIKTHRMLDRDYANRFLGFYLYHYNDYTPDLDTFMSKAMASINNKTDNELAKIREDFKESMKLAKVIFGKEAFRKIYRANDRMPPINKAIFDVISVQFALLSTEDRKLLGEKKNEFKNSLKEALRSDEDLFLSVTSSTGDKKRVVYRHKKIEGIIKKLIPHD